MVCNMDVFFTKTAVFGCKVKKKIEKNIKLFMKKCIILW